MVARISLTSDPNENCATTSDSELAEVDWRRLEARHAGDGALDRLGHLLRDVRGAGAG